MIYYRDGRNNIPQNSHSTYVKINAKHTHFMQAQAVEEPIASATGVITATSAAALLATEYTNRRRTA